MKLINLECLLPTIGSTGQCYTTNHLRTIEATSILNRMGKTYNNPIFEYMFILYLCITLLIAQASGLHIHVQHDDHSSSASGHIVDIHTASTHHDDIVTHHHEGAQDDHHPAAIDISQDYLVKKTSLLDPLALIIFFIGLFLLTPQLRRIGSQWRYKPPTINPCYYLLQPPLRAPPVH